MPFYTLLFMYLFYQGPRGPTWRKFRKSCHYMQTFVYIGITLHYTYAQRRGAMN